MKYILILLFSGFLANAQIKTTSLDLMPWPQKIEMKSGTFTLDKNFKVNIKGQPDTRIFEAATHFLRRLDGRTGLFLEQGFVTKENEFSLGFFMEFIQILFKRIFDKCLLFDL